MSMRIQYIRRFHLEIVFLNFSSLLRFQAFRFLANGCDPKTFVSRALLPNRTIISHEKFCSENKSIIGTSIFIMERILSHFFFRCYFRGRSIGSLCSTVCQGRAFIAENFYYLVIRFVLLEHSKHTTFMIILFRAVRFHSNFHRFHAFEARVSSFNVKYTQCNQDRLQTR